MNESAKRNLKPWPKGTSGNPAGRPIGARQRVSEAIICDISGAWEQHGVAVPNKLAIADPGTFAKLAAGLIPREFNLSMEARLPGGLEPDEWQLVMQVCQAIKLALPDASKRPPGEVLEFVSEAIRAHDAKLIEQDSPLDAA